MNLDTIEEEESAEPIRDVNTLLTKARHFLGVRNYSEVQDICKKILQKNKKNYTALVLLGKSYDNSDRTPLIFKKAVKINPRLPHAWLGLADYYETKENGSAKSKLFNVYSEILKLQVEENEAKDILRKVYELGNTLKDKESISILIKYVNRQNNEHLKEIAGRLLLDLLKNDVPCSSADMSTASTALNQLNNTNPRDNLKILLANTIKQHSDFAVAVKEILEIELFHNIPIKSWICKVLCKYFIETHTFFDTDTDICLDNLITGTEHCKWGRLLTCMILYSEGQYLTSFLNCIRVLNTAPLEDIAVRFIIDCSVMLENWPAVEIFIHYFRGHIGQIYENTPNFSQILSRFLILSLSKQNKFMEAVVVAKDIPIAELGLNEFSALLTSYNHTNNISENTFIDMGVSEEYRIEFQALSLMKAEKFNEAIVVLQNCPENAINYSLLGKAYWYLQLFDEAEFNLIKSAELYPYAYISWYNLGAFYYLCNIDLRKAKMYLEQAFYFNKTNKSTIQYLSDIYDRLNLDYIHIDFLNLVQNMNIVKEGWIYFKLGQLYFKIGDLDSAILNLHGALNINSQDASIYIWLGDVYHTRQLYEAALDAYSGALSLEQNLSAHCYCLTRAACIYSEQHNYVRAISVFDKVLQVQPQNLVAIRGIAEAFLQIAHQNVSTKIFNYARHNLQTCADFLHRILSTGINDSGLWILFGDTLIFLTRLPNEFSYIFLNEGRQQVRKNRLAIYKIAIEYFTMAAKVNNPYALYKCASAYLAYFNATNRMSLCYISYNLSVICVRLTPTSWENWNLLGKASYFLRKYDFAEFCFVKAIHFARDISVPKVWCNLGAIYLKLERAQFANFCFSRGKSALPSYPQCWIGQGLLAEIIQDDDIRLFAQASDNGNYRLNEQDEDEWNYRTARIEDDDNYPAFEYSMDEFKEVPNAIDIMEWFVTQEPTEPWVYYVLGYLLQQKGLLEVALTYYKRSYVIEVDAKNKNIILINSGRILMKLGKYNEAITIYRAVTETNLEITSDLAKAHYKVGELVDSYSVYTDALYFFCKNNEQKADVLVAMSNVLYKMTGIEEAQKLLLQAARLTSTPIPNNVFGFLIPGLEEDESNQLPRDLRQYEGENFGGFNIQFIVTQVVCHVEFKLAVNIIKKAINDHPNNAILWYYLAQLFLRESGENERITNARAASLCAHNAIMLSENTEHSFRRGNMLAIASVAQLSANNRERAQEIAREGLEEYPLDLDLWAALLLSIYFLPITHQTTNWINRTILYLRILGVPDSLNEWFKLIERIPYAI